MKGYQPSTNRVLDEKAGLVTDSHSILATWGKHIYQLFNVHVISDVGLREIHKAELIVHEQGVFEFEMTIEKLKIYKSLGFDEIPAEVIKEARGIKCPEIHKLINSI